MRTDEHGVKCSFSVRSCICLLYTSIVFKTLVARGAKGQFYVFDVPVAENLDLKKAAKAVGEKSIEMIHQKELLPLTGYVLSLIHISISRAKSSAR